MADREEKQHHSRNRFVMLVVALVLLVGAVALFGPPDIDTMRSTVAAFGLAGPIAAIMLIMLGILIMIPRTLMSIASGAIFGWLPGFSYIMIGCLLGASVGFLLGRLLGREFVAVRLARWADSGDTGGRSWLARIAGAVRKAMVRTDTWLIGNGTIGVWIARVLPVSHYGLLSYTCGTSSVTYRAFVMGTVLSSVHGALGYTAVGGAVFGEDGLAVALIIAVVLNTFSVGLLLLARWYMRRRQLLLSAT